MKYFIQFLLVLVGFSSSTYAQEIPNPAYPSLQVGTKLTNSNTSKKIALLLPFNLAKIQTDTVNTIGNRIKKDKFLAMTLDFYSGALLAIDSAKQLGIKVDVSIFDSEETKTSSNIINLIKEENLQNYGALIGPFYQANVEKTAELLSANEVAVISPLSKEIGKSYPNLFQTITNSALIRASVFDFMRSKNGNIIAVVDKKKGAARKYIAENQKEVRFATLDANGALVVASLKAMLVKNKTNYVVLETANTSLIKATMNALLTSMPMYTVQLVITEPNETLDTDEISFEQLVKLNLLYPSMVRENETTEGLIFDKNYKQKNKIAPSSFATRGFDITMDTIQRLANSNSYLESITLGATEQVETKMDYFQNESAGFANKGLYILYYDSDYTVKVAK